MKVGDSASITQSFLQADIKRYADLFGLNDEADVPQPLIAAMFSRLLGVDLPGPGTNYLKQDISWLASAPLGELLEASVTVTRLRPEKHLVDLETVCRIENGPYICRGRALVYVKDVGTY